MLNGDDNENGSKTNRISKKKKNKFARAAHFLYFQVAVFLDDYNAGLYD